NEDAPIIQAIRLADKLLKERENAETVYQHVREEEEPFSTEDNYQPKESILITTYFDGSHDFINDINVQKGVWIADGEAE
ncbi:hypothetical protein, partial [Listeria newyorkensis]